MRVGQLVIGIDCEEEDSTWDRESSVEYRRNCCCIRGDWDGVVATCNVWADSALEA